MIPMTAQLLPIESERSLLLNSWWDRRLPNEQSQPGHDRLTANPSDTAVFDWSLQILAESLREGVMIISRNVKPVYVNRQAKELCQVLSELDRAWAGLPQVISEICHKLIKNGNYSDQPLVFECQTAGEKTIRVRASWLNATMGDEATATGRAPQYILVLLENRTEILLEELQFEQQKYQFTDREMEIWSLLRQDYSYQEIAEKLHISLNTVKTHVKNIYAKKRWNQGQEKTLVS